MSDAQPMGTQMTLGVRVETAARGRKAALNDRVWRAKTTIWAHRASLARLHRAIDVTIWKAFWRSSLGVTLLPCPALLLSSSSIPA
jgi:hypothetical protein